MLDVRHSLASSVSRQYMRRQILWHSHEHETYLALMRISRMLRREKFSKERLRDNFSCKFLHEGNADGFVAHKIRVCLDRGQEDRNRFIKR